MACSKGRLAANRANALRSTGPRTEAGKARSRANSVKHGMTGAGVVPPDEAAAESVAARAAGLRRAFATEAMARRMAVLADRLDRLDRRDRADTAIRVRRASFDAAEQRQAEVDALIERLSVESDVAVRRLQMTPEGCDRLIELWEGLGGELAPGRGWSDPHVGLARALAGRQVGARAGERVDVLADLARGGARSLPVDDQLDDPAYRERVAEGARLALVELVADQIDRVEERRAELPGVDAETERAEAADLALFDESRRGELFRRYELATERHLFRALAELERLEVSEGPDSLPEAPEVPMGSFGEMAGPPCDGGEVAAEGGPTPESPHPNPPPQGEPDEGARPAVGRVGEGVRPAGGRAVLDGSPSAGPGPARAKSAGNARPEALIGEGWGGGEPVRSGRAGSRRPRLPGSG